MAFHVKPPDSSAPPMVLMSVVVVGAVLLAWDLRDLYLASLSQVIAEVAAQYFGFLL